MAADLRGWAYAYTQFIAWHSSALGGIDGYQNVLTILLVCVCLGLALVPLRSQPSTFLRGVYSAPAYCGMLLVSAVLSRLPLFLPLLPNPDEGNIIVGAQRLLRDPVFWRGADGSTNGPLTFYYPAILRLVGVPLNYAGARLANVLAFWGVLLFLYLTARLLMPEWAARLSVLPLFAAVLQFRMFDLVQYCSECVCSVLIAASVWLLARLYVKTPGGDHPWFQLGLVLGLIPFAKLQSVPMGAVIGAAALATIWRNRWQHRWRAAGWLIAGPMAVLLAVLIPLACCGVLTDFYQCYVANNLLYLGRPELSWTPGSFYQFAAGVAEIRRYLLWIPLFVAVVALAKIGNGKWRPSPAGLLAIGLLVASVYAIYAPGRPFQHYLIFLLLPVSLAAAAALASVVPRWSVRKCTLIFVAFTVVAPVIQGATDKGQSLDALATYPRDPMTMGALCLSQLVKPGDLIAVWGWSPELYVLTGALSATRDGSPVWAIEDTPLQEYYVARYMKDLQANPPKVFVDDIGPGRMFFKDRKGLGYENIRELRHYVDANFDLLHDVDSNRIFLRRGETAGLRPPVSPPLRLRCGAASVADLQEAGWRPDDYFYGGWGAAVHPQAPLPGVSALYYFERDCQSSCEYSIPVKSGAYLVRLHFIELTYGGPNARVFDVLVNHTGVFQDFDIFREAGGAGKPLIKEIRVEARNGLITIGLWPKLREAKINALEIWPAPAAPGS
jgi:hypothetical protein